jgi:hypothetical protein
MAELGVIFYAGPSLLTGDPIVAIATGLEGGSLNAKTGPMVQTWVIRPDLAPMDAKRANVDDAVCGDCALRGRDGRGSACYVPAWQGPLNVYKRFRNDDYPTVDAADLAACLEGRTVRLCAYGDPAAVPVVVWQGAVSAAAGWVGYTHQWRTCDRALQAICMASVESRVDMLAARRAGWRTFRIRRVDDDLIRAADFALSLRAPFASSFFVPLEFACPASDEGGHRTTCTRCQLCRGTSSPARHVAIVAHGYNGALSAWRQLQAVSS